MPNCDHVMLSAVLLMLSTSSSNAFGTNSILPRGACFSTHNMVGGYGGAMDFGADGSRLGGPRRKMRGYEDLFNPEEEVNKYIMAPDSVPARSDLGNSILVSGWARDRERTDQPVFDLLNHEDNTAFRFQRIVAFVDDEKFAKKRLLSRSARYTGLLDKLVVQQADAVGAMPTVEQLQGIDSWLAHVQVDPQNPNRALEEVKDIAKVASAASSSLKNVAIMISNAQCLTDTSSCVDAIQQLDGISDKVAFTIVSVGQLEDTPEGYRPYEVSDFGTEAGKVVGTISRDESYRLVTECLALKCGVNKALSFTEVKDTVNSTAAKLIKGLREAGYTRPQEIHHMIVAGVANYTKAINEYKQKIYEIENPDPEKLRLEKEERDRIDREAFAKQQAEWEERKAKEIDEIARSWAKREYFRKSMSGNMGMSEEEYIESVWERAMFEGDLKYRMMHGGQTDERKETQEFEEKQARKREAALKRAREALEGVGTISEGEGKVKVPDDDDDDDDDDE